MSYGNEKGMEERVMKRGRKNKRCEGVIRDTKNVTERDRNVKRHHAAV